MAENLQTETETNELQQDEAAAEWALLENSAGDTEPAGGGDGLAAPVQAPPSLAQEISSTITIAVGMLKPVFPSLGVIYLPEVVEGVGESVAAVCEKHGWLKDGLAVEYKEELACACICLPLAISTRQAILNDLEVRRQRQQDKQAANDEIPPGQNADKAAE